MIYYPSVVQVLVHFNVYFVPSAYVTVRIDPA